MGIALAHFELACQELGLKGKWRIRTKDMCMGQVVIRESGTRKPVNIRNMVSGNGVIFRS